MWWHSPLTTLLIIASLQAIKCQEKGSLTYVIDNTLSMRDDIEQVKSNTEMITKTIFEEASSQIQNMVLVTFNDPYAVLETKTERKDVFQSKIDDVYVHNNYGNPDCEEMSMTGILLALENSLPHSFIYVFTDATAKDYEKGNQIQKMCQEKQSQIVFVLTGYCSKQRELPPFQVYYDIAAACSGLTLLVGKQDVSSIFVPIKDSIKGKKGMITSRTIPAYKYASVTFEINNGTEYVRVEASGLQVKLSVVSTHRSLSHRQRQLIWLSNVKVLRLTHLTPGTYKALVFGYSTTTINVIGNANDFSFELGFSKLETTNLKDTMAQPTSNSPTRLFISVNDSSDSFNIQSAQILNMDEYVVATYELRRISKNFYTTVPFQAPSKMFKVAVIGKSTVTDKTIKHLAPFPITPQTEKKEPVIMISEGTSVKVEYGEALHLTCKVTAYPKPTIRWTDGDQKTLQSQVSMVKSPYEYVSYLSIPDVTHNGFYYCHAANSIGKDKRTVEVLVIDPFDSRTPLNDTIQVKYGDKAALKCDIRSSKPVYFRWSFVDKKYGYPRSILTDIYALSENSSVLQINKMTQNTEGTYTCTAVLRNNMYKHKSHITEVKLIGLTKPNITSDSSRVYSSIEEHDKILKIPCKASGLPKPTITWKLRHRTIKQGSKYSLEDGFLVIKDPTIRDTATYECQAQNDAGSVTACFNAQVLQTPQITGDPKKVATVGSSTSIECTVTKGVPTPTVSWQLMVRKEWIPLELSDSQKVLRIPKVSEVNTGRYKCIARNIVGSSEYVTLLVVQVSPNITSKSTVYRSIEGQDSILRIKCKTTGFPKPTITWTKGQKLILPNTKYTFDEGDLVIKEPVVEDAGTYVCSAGNVLGSVNAAFNAEVLQIPQTSSETLKTVRAGSPVEIKCRVAKGVPAPTISWQVLREGESKFEQLTSSDSVLNIQTVSEKDAGRYKCIAHNIVGDAEHVTVLVVQASPAIISDNSVVYKSVEGHNRILRIPCKATGFPKPIMSWRLRNEFIPSNAKYSFEDEALIIKDLNINDAGSYVCVATNDAGSISRPFQVEILQIPVVTGEISKTANSGTTINIKCTITKGVPVPTITWQFMAKDKSVFEQIEGSDNTLRISEVGERNSGQYKCIAHNNAGDNEHITILNIQDSPRILPNYTSEYKVVEGREKELKIPCKAIGLPKPKVMWEMKQKRILPNTKYSLEDDTLIIKDPAVADTATYVCITSNEAGSASVSFGVEVYQTPQVSGKASITVKMGNIVDIKCLIQKGMPAPKITWKFMAKGESKYANINGSKNVLNIARVSEGDAGKYKCIAQNIAGRAEHDTVMVVEFAPYITNKVTATIEGLEGDVALRIPCNVRGVPQPVISWSFNGTAISTESHYSITEDALIVINPKTNNTGSYKCEASNNLGSDTASFNAVVKDKLDGYGKIESIKINKVNRTSYKLECGSPGQSVRWFVEGIDMHISSNYFELNDFDAAYNGNYTCRVSDMSGAYTKTYHAIIGSPPKFDFPQEETTFDWEGNDDELDCSVGTADRAEIKWTYNGEVLNENTSSRLGVVRKWGHYTCNVTNDFGEIYRTFDVVSSLCLIPKNPKEYDIMPLILSEDSTWPALRSTSKYFSMVPGEKIKLSCPNYDTEENNLKMFPSMQEITAICDKQDVFTVKGKPYKLKELGCKHIIIPKVINTNEKCGQEQTNKIVVGYNMSRILETYEVCLDSSRKLPIYSVVSMPSNYDYSTDNIWYKHPAISYTTNNNVYTCHDSSSTCCYVKSQLVNAKTIMDGPPQNSTFIDVINEVPLWVPCNDTMSSWDNIEKQIRYRMDLIPASMIWSGTHAWQNQNGHLVPRYLFKLIEFIDDTPIAVVYVNGPSPKSSDILCKNICANGDVIWLDELGDHVYCCNGEDFREAFDFYH